jgi:cytochrome c oxidase subunit I+III
LVLGVRGMTRRIYTYPEHAGWGSLNLAASVGAALLAFSFLIFIVNVVRTLRNPVGAPANPWDGSTLEWACNSPPPVYNFEHIPVVGSRTPLWEGREALGQVTGLQVAHKEVVVTRGLDARPDLREPVPIPSLWPFIAALATTGMLIGSIFNPSALVWGSVPVAVGLLGWLYPKKQQAAA